MDKKVKIIGAGLAGSECALQLAWRGIQVTLVEMRPEMQTAVHKTGLCAELVCSNSLKSKNPDSAAGMLKAELQQLGSFVYECALACEVPAGGALAVDREQFAKRITELIREQPGVQLELRQATDISAEAVGYDALILASGPLTSDALADSLTQFTRAEHLSFYDAAAPIVMEDSLDMSILFRQSRYEEGLGDYLNAPFTKAEYEAFITELLNAQRVIQKDFETKDLFQACQPIEEIARAGFDAPRFGTMKPVGLTDPRTGRRPWAAVQLRSENENHTCYNLVGFQTNLTFPEQARVFRMIPGLEQAEFARYGVMHRNTFISAPALMDKSLYLKDSSELCGVPVYVAGQLSGTEGYVEAIRSGLHAALSVTALLNQAELPFPDGHTVWGALLDYATNPETVDYQPSHVNFGMIGPLPKRIRNKKERYHQYALYGAESFRCYLQALDAAGISVRKISE